MNKTSLSSLYRRLTATATPAPEADDLAANLAASPVGSKLAAMLRELRTDSEALAFGVARVQRGTAKQVAPARRHASVMRWTTAMAATFVAAIGVFALRQPHTTPATPAAHTVARADRIFSDYELSQPKAPAKADELFRGSFNG